jgi:hypothetical protein
MVRSANVTPAVTGVGQRPHRRSARAAASADPVPKRPRKNSSSPHIATGHKAPHRDDTNIWKWSTTRAGTFGPLCSELPSPTSADAQCLLRPEGNRPSSSNWGMTTPSVKRNPWKFKTEGSRSAGQIPSLANHYKIQLRGRSCRLNFTSHYHRLAVFNALLGSGY